ncbi:MAG: UDP-N-acetylmuramoyl-L-alanine--D-glutamate ligase, partial [Candidatus Levyibacteriota bacterium]
FLDTLTPQSKVVLELSSFQLQDLTKSPHIAVMLMTTSEHLDYHKDRDEYLDAKRSSIKYQTAADIAVLNSDYEATKKSADFTKATVYWVTRFGETQRGCFVRNGDIIYRNGGKDTHIIPANHIFIPGQHNLENVCAATVVAMQSGVSPKNIAAVLQEFRGLVHRIEFVREVHGVKYYDDSFATTPESAIAAVQAFPKNPKVLILGGSSKGADFTTLGGVIAKEDIRGIVGIGVEWEKMKQQFPATFPFPVIEGCQNMKEIIVAAKKLAKPGDVVLLSPACASFGMFTNYKERGNLFKEEVNLL